MRHVMVVFLQSLHLLPCIIYGSCEVYSKTVFVVDGYRCWLDFPVIVSSLGAGCGQGRWYKEMIT